VRNGHAVAEARGPQRLALAQTAADRLLLDVFQGGALLGQMRKRPEHALRLFGRGVARHTGFGQKIEQVHGPIPP